MNNLQDVITGKESLIHLLSLKNEDMEKLFSRALNVKKQYTGKLVYLRGLIELSNTCRKDCLYCGIRKSNKKLQHYLLKPEEVINAARFAVEHGFGSLVFQSGERTDKEFINYIDQLLRDIHRITNNRLAITLSLGEQTEETYRRWMESGASRYLLRIETSNRELYYKLHPQNNLHSFENRLKTLEYLKKLNYHTGTGVMIGLPFQTVEDLAEDLLFMKELEVDMVGMGPYIEHNNTPLKEYFSFLPGRQERYERALKMIAALRLLMPEINIASTTALETLNSEGRLKALNAGANVFMPNLTPAKYREDYFLYDGKPGIKTEMIEYLNDFDLKLQRNDQQIGWNQQGNSLHWQKNY